MYPFLSLKQITIDPELVRRLPRQLAYYHLALPIASDDHQITVAVAHSDNPKVIKLLGTVLNAQVIPVCSLADEIKAVLDAIWQVQGNMNPPAILVWTDSSSPQAAKYRHAEAFAAALSAKTTVISNEHSTLEMIMQIVNAGDFSLMITNEGIADFPSLLNKVATPILLVRGEEHPIQHVLVVLRGHTPDFSVLDFVLPLVQFCHAQVTLLAIAQPVSEFIATVNLTDLLSTESSFGSHITDCVQLLNDTKIAGRLKLRQGSTPHPEDEIAAEVLLGQYDLIAIAAEAYGDFVYRVLTTIQERDNKNQCPLLIVKPGFILHN